MGGTPLRATAVESALAGGASPADAAAHAAEGTSAADDIRATRAYREHLARVLVSRALTEAHSRSLSRTARGASPTSRCPRVPPAARPHRPPARHPARAPPAARPHHPPAR
ncbi:MAG: hypothetical protein JO037_26910, partial [Actinobacteria bacterium]|nr:hypothetical protein [Actinomycetota bacterium]